MNKTIVIANQKGGVGKTTTAAALSAGLKKRGYKVLALDLDPQGNLSDSIKANNQNEKTIYEVLLKKEKIENTIQKNKSFDIVPANILLAGTETEISQLGKEQRLKEILEKVKKNYDYIIIDTPPALGLLTINALTACDEVLIPTTAGYFSASGIKQLYETIENVKNYCNRKISINGILITRYNNRTNIGKEMMEVTQKVGEYINSPVYEKKIRQSVIIEEAQTKNSDIYSYNEKAAVVEDYDEFVSEFLEKEMQTNEAE